MAFPGEVRRQVPQMDLLVPETRRLAERLMAPDFDDAGNLTTLRFSPYFIGSSPMGVVHHLSGIGIETWTQLSKRREGRGFEENMYVQAVEGLPGVQIDFEAERIWVEPDQVAERAVEVMVDFSVVFEGKDPLSGSDVSDQAKARVLDKYAITPRRAAGLYYMLTRGIAQKSIGIKGQQIGLFSWGLNVKDAKGRPAIYYDGESHNGVDVWEVLAQALMLKAKWQEQLLRRENPNLIMHLDEPYLTQVGSSQISVPRAAYWIRWQTDLLGGNVGAHCCGQTDYALLLGDPNLKIAALDLTGVGWDGTIEGAEFAQSFLAAAPTAGLEEFFRRRGKIAMGVMPFNRGVSVEQVVALSNHIIDGLMQRGCMGEEYLDQIAITPVCGGGTETVANATHAFNGVFRVAAELQDRYLRN